MRSAYDPALFIYTKGLGIVVVHVDDLIFAADEAIMDSAIGALLKAFNDRDLNEVSWLLGMEVKRATGSRRL